MKKMLFISLWACIFSACFDHECPTPQPELPTLSKECLEIRTLLFNDDDDAIRPIMDSLLVMFEPDTSLMGTYCNGYEVHQHNMISVINLLNAQCEEYFKAASFYCCIETNPLIWEISITWEENGQTHCRIIDVRLPCDGPLRFWAIHGC